MKKTFLLFCLFFCLNYGNVFSQCVQPTIPTVNSSTNTICDFQSTVVILSVASGSLNSASNWYWYSGACGLTPVGTGTSINVSPASTTNFFVRGEGGCVTPATCASVTIVSNPLPFGGINSQNPLCFGQANGSATMTGTYGSPFTYSWSPSGATTPVLNGLSGGTYIGIITNIYGCSESTTFTINQPNVLTLSVTPTQIICYGAAASILAQASGGTLPYFYSLTNLTTNSTTTITTVNGIIATPNLTSTAQYTANVIDANGCAVGPMTMVVNVKPPLWAIGYLVNACDRDSSLLIPAITSIGNGGPYTYNWSNNANTYSTSVVSSLTNSPASYSVSISDGCTIPSATAAFLVNVSACVGLKENKNSNVKISFYPNPVKDLLSVDVENTDDAIKIKLFSILGQEILQQEIIKSKSVIDLSALKNGMYYLSVYSKNEKLLTEKVIIQH
jgi:hypothetical protein